MKSRLALVAGIAAAALTLSGCTAGGPEENKLTSSSEEPTESASEPPAEQIELSFLTFETPNLTPEYWDDAIARVSEKVPGVKIKKLVGENTATYLQQLFQSGQAPDMMMSISPNGFAQKGQLAEWTPEELAAAGVPGNKEGAIDGKVYALSKDLQPTPLVYYNKTMFKEAGIDGAPKTYAEFLAASEKLKAAGFNALEIGGGGEDTWVVTFPLNAVVSSDILVDTPDWFTKRETGEVKFSDPDFVAAAKKVVDLKTKGYFDPDGMTRSYADVEQAFLAGKAAMYPMGSWFSAAADATPPDSEVGVFGWPSDTHGNVVPVVAGGNMMVNAAAKDVALAKEWAVAFTFDKENLDNGLLTDGLMYSMADYVLPEGTGPVFDQGYEAYTSARDAGKVVPAWGNTSGDGSLPPGFNDKMAPAIVDLLNGKLSPADFGAYLDTQYDALAIN